MAARSYRRRKDRPRTRTGQSPKHNIVALEPAENFSELHTTDGQELPGFAYDDPRDDSLAYDDPRDQVATEDSTGSYVFAPSKVGTNASQKLARIKITFWRRITNAEGYTYNSPLMSNTLRAATTPTQQEVDAFVGYAINDFERWAGIENWKQFAHDYDLKILTP